VIAKDNISNKLYASSCLSKGKSNGYISSITAVLVPLNGNEGAFLEPNEMLRSKQDKNMSF